MPGSIEAAGSPSPSLFLHRSYAHLHAHSAFSFGEGASSPEDLVRRATEHEQPAVALTDTMSVSGVPALVRASLKAGIKPIGGSEIILEGGDRLTLLCDGPTGWASLCRLLSAAHLRDIKRTGARLRWDDLTAPCATAGLHCLSGRRQHSAIGRLVRQQRYPEALTEARRQSEVFGGRWSVEVTRTLAEGEYPLSRRLFQLADHLGVAAVATNPVLHADKASFPAHEALCRLRLGVPLEQQHADLPANGEGYLKAAESMAALFTDRPDALDNAVRLAERLASPLDPTSRHFPRFAKLPQGHSALSFLSELTWAGVTKRYGKNPAPEVMSRLYAELEVIHELGYGDYFLVCWDTCREARKRGIGHALRGSAVGSAVAHCLEMSPHDPLKRRISFERFLSKSRRKPPDVDIDFEHDERDHIAEYTRATYGHDRVGNVSNYVTYRGRSLLRDMAKVLGISDPEITQLREILHHRSRGDDIGRMLKEVPELKALQIDPARYGDLLGLCSVLAGLPRHLGTHSSGLVVSDVPLDAIAPLQWSAKGVTVVALDKDDIESPGIGCLKMDQLCLRALTAVGIATSRLIDEDPTFDYHGRDREDADTLAMIRAAQTVGVFQMESPAQMALATRLQPERFEDLVASVALIRPGPLMGKTVDPYIWRRKGWAKVVYPMPELEPVLKDTYGRILFQDQVLDVVKIVGGYSDEEADVWQQAMKRARSDEEVMRLGLELLERARPRGLSGKRFERLWKQIRGFTRYGFCHGHSLAFADHAQGTAWLLRHYPAQFLAGVLSVEPCGYWPVATVVAEAGRRGVVACGPCINTSDARQWTVESPERMRCSLAYVRGVGLAGADAILAEREARGPFESLSDACRRLWFLTRERMEWLALSGAFDSLLGCEGNRRRALWSLPALHRHVGADRPDADAAAGQGPLPELGEGGLPSLPPSMPDFPEGQRFQREWQSIGFSASGHPMQFHRDRLEAAGVLPCAALDEVPTGNQVALAGLVLRPHRPPTPSGQIWTFLALEDETGLVHVTVSPDVYHGTGIGSMIWGQPALVITGRVEKRGAGAQLMAEGAEMLL